MSCLKLIFTNLVFLPLSLQLCARAKTVRVACIGNSVTYGLHVENREQNCYPAKLQVLLGNQYTVNNFGHSGATLLKNGHNPYYKTAEFLDAIRFHPDIAVIDLGLNDTDPRDWPNYRLNFEADYTWLIDTFRKANPSVKIYICLLTPIFSGHPRFKSGTRDWFWQIQQLLPGIAKANKTGLIDLHTPLYNRPDLFADNVHPDKEGASIIAHTVYQAITQNFGALNVAHVFTDNMVLQRERCIPVFGSANGGDKVDVTLNKLTKTAIADKQGHWKVLFPAMVAGGPYTISVKGNDTVIRLKNVLIGDVWLCSGQSNMAFPLKKSLGGPGEATAAGKNRNLRLYQLKVLKETDAMEWDTSVLRGVNQLHYFSGSWKVSSQLSAADFSAVAWYFGKTIGRHQHIPIGLIEVAAGGSPVESWISRYDMEHDDLLVDVMNNWRKSDFMMKWCRDRADTNLKKSVLPRQRHPYEPCYNYEAGLSVLTHTPIKGVIWYQGESNAQNPELYKHEFETLVKGWRHNWGADLPFYFVQLSGINRPAWPVFREMERRLAKEVTGCKMAVSMDLGDSLNVHYINKKPVGERLALLAEKYTYKRRLTAEGPEPLYARQSGNTITIQFPNGERLSAAGGKPLTGYEIVTDKGIRFNVTASIKNNRVIIRCPANEQIEAAYYAMQPYTRANLINKAGLPASTFCLYRHGDLFY